MALHSKPSAVKAIKEFLLPSESELMSEGEEIIRDFLEDEGFTYTREVEIRGLNNDPRSYRRADFHLPKYGLYVEFLGGWNNNKDERERYREKMRVYGQNGVPCVYLFPENLGTLEHSFRRRAAEALHRAGMKRELFRLNLKFWLQDHRLDLMLAVGLIFLTWFVDDPIDRVVSGAMTLWVIYFLWREWRRYFAPVQPRAWVKRSGG
jgi:hypothetical protein